MKHFIIILCIVSNGFIQAQKEDLEINVENICKDWIFSDVINPNKTPEQVEEIKYFLEENTISFKKDMIFEFRFLIDRKGTWELKGNIIHTKDQRGKSTWTVHKLTKDKLHISRNEAEQIIIYTAN